MLDDFRESGGFVEDDTQATSPDAETSAQNGGGGDLLFGMTPTQRFVLAVLFFLSMCMLGSFCLLITEKIALPLF